MSATSAAATLGTCSAFTTPRYSGKTCGASAHSFVATKYLPRSTYLVRLYPVAAPGLLVSAFLWHEKTLVIRLPEQRQPLSVMRIVRRPPRGVSHVHHPQSCKHMRKCRSCLPRAVHVTPTGDRLVATLGQDVAAEPVGSGRYRVERRRLRAAWARSRLVVEPWFKETCCWPHCSKATMVQGTQPWLRTSLRQ